MNLWSVYICYDYLLYFDFFWTTIGKKADTETQLFILLFVLQGC